MKNLYLDLLKADREITQEMVKSGELSPEMGELRDSLREDEILESIPEEYDW